MRDTAYCWQAALAFLLSLSVLVGAILWLDNVHIATSNGMFKSIEAEPWIADPGHARLVQSNYLYFPLYGQMTRLLDWFGISRGVAWKQFALLNAFWASVCVAFAYAFVHRLSGSARAAALAACFHLGSGFVLLLAVINEDIMPGYTLVFGAMALAALWFDRPTVWRVIAVAALFTFGWLIEWRLIFPTLPALTLALLLAPGSVGRRLAMVGVLLAAIPAVAGLVCLAWEGHNGALGLHDVMWTGKAVGSGWGGFSLQKTWLLLAGISNYFLVVMLGTDAGSVRDAAPALSASIALQIAILMTATVLLWPRRKDPRVRSIAAVFLGTFGAGEIFNFYSQPQDPQMQINVMPWLTVAWSLIVIATLAGERAGLRNWRFFAVLAVLSVLPLAWNMGSLSMERGNDARWAASARSIEKALPPDSTVFLYFGFEQIIVWQHALWSHNWDWDGPSTVPPSPAPSPKFKFIAINAGAMRRPGQTGEQHAATLKRDIELVLDSGYRLVTTSLWDWTVQELADRLAPLSGASSAPAIHAMLHQDYEAEPLLVDEMAGAFYELKRRRVAK